LYDFLKRLEKQGVLVKTRNGNEKIGSFAYSQEYYSFTDPDHKILLNLLGVKASGSVPNGEKDLGNGNVPLMSNDDFFETGFLTYKRVKQIGNGGSGTVFLVKDEEAILLP